MDTVGLEATSIPSPVHQATALAQEPRPLLALGPGDLEDGAHAKVSDLEDTRGGEEDVLRLEVVVAYARVVEEVEPCAELVGEVLRDVVAHAAFRFYGPV